MDSLFKFRAELFESNAVGPIRLCFVLRGVSPAQKVLKVGLQKFCSFFLFSFFSGGDIINLFGFLLLNTGGT